MKRKETNSITATTEKKKENEEEEEVHRSILS